MVGSECFADESTFKGRERGHHAISPHVTQGDPILSRANWRGFKRAAYVLPVFVKRVAGTSLRKTHEHGSIALHRKTDSAVLASWQGTEIRKSLIYPQNGVFLATICQS